MYKRPTQKERTILMREKRERGCVGFANVELGDWAGFFHLSLHLRSITNERLFFFYSVLHEASENERCLEAAANIVLVSS